MSTRGILINGNGKDDSGGGRGVRRVPKVIRERFRKIEARLAHWPAVSGAKALSGDLAGFFRIRTGDYRIRFRVTGETVLIDKIGHRDKFYDDE
jgi:mRNA-degrading endonuclease RelE of RelBE toxin-antitoxin system